MPIAFLDARHIAGRTRLPELIAHLRDGHRAPAPQVQRMLMEQATPAGSTNAVLIWPAWHDGGALGVKVVTAFPENRAVPAVQGLYLLFDGATGAPQAVLDGTELTCWKTAADVALGADCLARRDAQTLLMVGAGALAPHLIRAHQAVRPGLRRVWVWNRSADKARAVAAGVAGTPAQAVPDLEAAVRGADIVCCATASTAPLVRGAWLAPGTHLGLVGGFTRAMREADDEAVRRARVFVDSRWSTLAHVGDLVQPIADGVIGAGDVLADLFDLCAGRHAGRATPSEITLFKAGGGGHLDLMAAQHIAARAA